MGWPFVIYFLKLFKCLLFYKVFQSSELLSVLTDEWIQSVTGLLIKVIEHGKMS